MGINFDPGPYPHFQLLYEHGAWALIELFPVLFATDRSWAVLQLVFHLIKV